MQKPKMGEWREIRATARKCHEGDETIWQREELPKLVRGMFIGSRTVWNGERIALYESGEYGEKLFTGTAFAPSEALKVWLFVPHEQQNFVRVFPQDVSE